MMNLRKLHVQVAIGMLAGVLVGLIWPDTGAALKPLGDGFIRLIRMIIAPIVFFTVARGVSQTADLKSLGRAGAKALLYFELVSLLALLVGLLVAHVVRPGAGMNLDLATLDTSSLPASMRTPAASQGWTDQLLNIIPDSFLSAFVSGNLMSVLLIALLFGVACTRMGAVGERVSLLLDDVSKVFFSIVHLIVKLAPLGAFGGMAYTVGKYGIGTLWRLGLLTLSLYLACALFILVVLGLIARWSGYSLLALIRYLRDEVLVVAGTSSTEAVMPQLLEKLQLLGASRPVVGLVLPAGYSLNLDGSCIYITLAAIFLAQATGIDLTFSQEALLLGVATLTSKGTGGVAGIGLIMLASTLAAVPVIPIESLALLIGIDRLLSVGRAVTSLIGNAVATLAIARWERALDPSRLQAELSRGQLR